MGYRFGSTSNRKLGTCHPDLQKVMGLAISRSRIDFGIREGMRTLETQQHYFELGYTTLDGVEKKSKHQSDPSMAADIYIYHPDIKIRRKLQYDKASLAYVAGVIVSCTKELYEKGEIKYDVRCGLNWDMDGVILMDQSFDDMPHFELKDRK